MENINQNPMPKMEILPRGVERAFSLAQRAYKFGKSIVKNTNVQLPTMLPRETDLKTSNHLGGASEMLDAELYDNQLSLEFED